MHWRCREKNHGAGFPQAASAGTRLVQPPCPCPLAHPQRRLAGMGAVGAAGMPPGGLTGQVWKESGPGRFQGCFTARRKRLWRGAGPGTLLGGTEAARDGPASGPRTCRGALQPWKLGFTHRTEEALWPCAMRRGLPLAGQRRQSLQAVGPVEEERAGWDGAPPSGLPHGNPCTMHCPARRGRGLPNLRAADVPAA